MTTQITFIKQHLTKFAGRYRYEQLLGQGGMGVVFKAYDTLLERDVAIKILNEELRENREAQRIFMVEARNLATLKHPNLVAIHDVAIVDEVAMLVTEFVQGRSIEEHLQFYGGMDEPALLKVAHQLCSALAHMHDRGVIHRDIKPGNLLIRQDGSLKVVDFGLARSLEQLTLRSTRRRGTLAYMAPEQIEGGDLTVKTDIYQVGVTLYQLATACLPFDSEDMAHAHVHLEPTPILDHAPMLSPGTSELIEQCLEKDPAKRPASAAALAASIKQVLAAVGGDATQELRVIGALDFSPPTAGIDPSLQGLETRVPAASVDSTEVARGDVPGEAGALSRTSTRDFDDAEGAKLSSKQALSVLAALVVVLVLCAGTIVVLLQTDRSEQPEGASITRAEQPTNARPENTLEESPAIPAAIVDQVDDSAVEADPEPSDSADVSEAETSETTKAVALPAPVERAPEVKERKAPRRKAAPAKEAPVQPKDEVKPAPEPTPSVSEASSKPTPEEKTVSEKDKEETDTSSTEEKESETTRRVIRRKVIRQKTTPTRKVPRSF